MVFREVEQAFARYDLDRRDACPTILLGRLSDALRCSLPCGHGDMNEDQMTVRRRRNRQTKGSASRDAVVPGDG